MHLAFHRSSSLLRVAKLGVDLAGDDVLVLRGDDRLYLVFVHTLEPRLDAQRVGVEHHATHGAAQHLRAVRGPDR